MPFGLIDRGAIGRSRGRNPGSFGMIGFFPAGRGYGRLDPAGTRHLDRDDRHADLDRLALFGQQPGHRAVPRGRQLDHRLGGLHLHDDLAVLDPVARLDVPGHDVGFGQALARVGQLELLQFGHGRSSVSSSRVRVIQIPAVLLTAICTDRSHGLKRPVLASRF